MNATSPPKLDKPGAGLPPLEWAVANFILVPRYLKTTKPQEAFENIEKLSSSILKTARALPPENLSKQILIPRLQGLEDSSRYWSVAMTVQHLVIVNQLMAQAAVSLSSGTVPEEKVSTADVKPLSDVDAGKILDQYEESIKSIVETLRPLELDRYPDKKYPHPWFGPLSAREWLLFIPLHQRIHKQQIKEIVKRL